MHKNITSTTILPRVTLQQYVRNQARYGTESTDTLRTVFTHTFWYSKYSHDKLNTVNAAANCYTSDTDKLCLPRYNLRHSFSQRELHVNKNGDCMIDRELQECTMDDTLCTSQQSYFTCGSARTQLQTQHTSHKSSRALIAQDFRTERENSAKYSNNVLHKYQLSLPNVTAVYCKRDARRNACSL